METIKDLYITWLPGVLGVRWPSRLVATASEDRLSVPTHTSFAAAAIAKQSAIYIGGRVMKAIAKLTFIVAVMAITATVNAWAQIADRYVDAEAPAEEPVTPAEPGKAPQEPPPVFTVNNNIDR
jgi:hypothetical protein